MNPLIPATAKRRRVAAKAGTQAFLSLGAAPGD